MKKTSLKPSEDDILSGYFTENPPEKKSSEQSYIYNTAVFRKLCIFFWSLMYTWNFKRDARHFFAYRSKVFEASGELERALHDSRIVVLNRMDGDNRPYLSVVRILYLMGRVEEAIDTLQRHGLYKMTDNQIISVKDSELISQKLIDDYRLGILKDDLLQAYDVEKACHGFSSISGKKSNQISSHQYLKTYENKCATIMSNGSAKGKL